MQKYKGSLVKVFEEDPKGDMHFTIYSISFIEKIGQVILCKMISIEAPHSFNQLNLFFTKEEFDHLLNDTLVGFKFMAE